MARRLILDTGVLIAAERRGLDLSLPIADDEDVVVAAVTVAELRTGIELADGPRRPRRNHFVAQVLARLPVEPYDVATAEAHGRLLAHVHRTGTPRGAHDLIVAATAVSTGRTLLTSDRSARFAELPGLDCIELG